MRTLSFIVGLFFLILVGNVVTAAFEGYVLHVDVNDYASYYLLAHKNPLAGTSYDVGNGKTFSVSYDASILNVSFSGESFCIPIQTVLAKRSDGDIYSYGFYYCGAGSVSIKSNDTSFEASNSTIYVDPSDHNPPHNFEILVQNNNSVGTLKFYVDAKEVSDGSINTAFASVLEVTSGTKNTGAMYDLYIDNVVEKIDIFTAEENFDDQKDDYFNSDQSSGSATKEIVPASSVPFFSSSLTSGAVLLLVLFSGIWFLRKR